MNQETLDKVKELHAAKKDASEICDTLNISLQDFRIYCKKLHITNQHTNQDRINKILDLFNQGFSIKTIAFNLKLNYKTVKKVFKNNNIKYSQYTHANDYNKVLELYNLQTPVKEIASILNVELYVIYDMFKRLNLKVYKQPLNEVTPNIENQILELRNNKLSARNIANNLNINIKSILQIFKKK